MKVIAALLKEPMHVPNLGSITAQLPGPKFPAMKMTLINDAVLLEAKGRFLLVPKDNFRYIELEKAEK